MKKKFLFGLAGLAVMAAAVTVTVSSVNANSPESNLLTKNLEALTQGESGWFVCTGPLVIICIDWGDGITGGERVYL